MTSLQALKPLTAVKPDMSIPFKSIMPPRPSTKERLLRLIWKLSPQGPAFDSLLTRRLPELKHLPEKSPSECIPFFDETRVTIQQCPFGPWSTPLIDVMGVVKCAMGFESRRVLEIGSYVGHTAKLLAENTKPDVRITTLDENPDHGSAYRNTPVEGKMDRRIGKVSMEPFKAGEKFDLIFVDADHRFPAVINDTEVAFNLLSEKGVILWHDYQQTNHFHGWNQVPEALKIFSSYIPIVSVSGTWLAMHSRYPGWETSKILSQATAQTSGDPWKDKGLRG